MEPLCRKKAGERLRGCIPVLFVIAIMLCLTACQSKEPITSDQFQEKAKALSYTPVDITDQFGAYPEILSAVSIEDDSLYVEFYEIDGQDNATAFFNSSQASVEEYKGSGSTNTSVSTNSYQKYTLKTAENYYLVERVETTLVFAYCPASDSDSLNSFIAELGY